MTKYEVIGRPAGDATFDQTLGMGATLDADPSDVEALVAQGVLREAAVEEVDDGEQPAEPDPESEPEPVADDEPEPEAEPEAV